MYSVITILKGFHLRFRSFLTMESALADPLENMKKEVWRFLCEKWSDKDYKNKLNWEKLKVLDIAGSKAFRKVQYDEANSTLIYSETHTLPRQAKRKYCCPNLHKILFWSYGLEIAL